MRTAAPIAAAVGLVAACGPIVRPATFPGARHASTEARLEGPFDGVVVDANTDEPLADVTILGIWSFERGDGLVVPAGSVVARTRTDAAGRYRVPRLPERPHGPALRLARFVLVAYKRGYAAYRSDVTPDGRARTDFTVRQGRIVMAKWRENDRHDTHLAYLAPASVLEGDLAWAFDDANAAAAGWQAEPRTKAQPAGQGRAERAATRTVLDATALLPPEEVVKRTGFIGTFRVDDLGDLPPTSFYHGLHLEAVDHEESWDVAVRVWKDPPDGLDAVRAIIEATLPGVETTDDVTETTWVYDGGDVRAVAFLEPERDVAVLLSCGADLCPDTATAVVLARAVHDRLDRLSTRSIPDEPKSAGEAPSPASAGDETKPAPSTTGSGADEGERHDGASSRTGRPAPAGAPSPSPTGEDGGLP